MTHTRRRALQIAAGGLAATSSAQMPPWTPGTLDIHHISTGRGSCTFLLCPDGTTMMVDCGAVDPAPAVLKYAIDAKPDGSRRPGEWVARYIARHMQSAGRDRVDVFLLTHLHNDHMGTDSASAPQSRHGDYRLSGLMDVAETMPIERVIDRAWPDYRYPEPLNDPHQLNYRAFVKGRKGERFRPGSASQLALRDPSAYPGFAIRNIAANGEVWTGEGEKARQLFPELQTLSRELYPNENMCSAAIRLSYGRFRYFTGGDLPFDTRYGHHPWRDIETPVALACGPVDVTVANHHGYIDATGPGFVSALRPRAFVINAWHATHPSMSSLNNMLSRELYPGERDVFATAVKPEAKIAIQQLNQMKSDNGHVIIRVPPPGDAFHVFVTGNADESGRVLAHFGAYPCG